MFIIEVSVFVFMIWLVLSFIAAVFNTLTRGL